MPSSVASLTPRRYYRANKTNCHKRQIYAVRIVGVVINGAAHVDGDLAADVDLGDYVVAIRVIV